MTYEDLLNNTEYPESINELKKIPVISDISVAPVSDAKIVSKYNTLVSTYMNLCSNTTDNDKIISALNDITEYIKNNESVLSQYLMNADIITKIITAVIDLENYTIVKKKQTVRSIDVPENYEIGDIWLRIMGSGCIIPYMKTTDVNSDEIDNYTQLYWSTRSVASNIVGSDERTIDEMDIDISELKNNAYLLKNNEWVSDISSGNLDDYTTPGTYTVTCVNPNKDATYNNSNVSNVPNISAMSSSAEIANGKLIVEEIYDGNLMQTYKISSKNNILIYCRNYKSGIWYSWYSLNSTKVS